MSPLHDSSVTKLAALVKAGEVSCRDVVDAHLGRIAALNGRINAVTVVLADDARRAAERLDAERRSGKVRPLHGVPFTVKETLDCVGTPTTHGIPALRDALPFLDAPVVSRLRDAGAILIGRTNTSEMGMRLGADNPLRGLTRNPRDPRVTTGGSSGGDAAAVAAGMTPLGIGTDIGGSLRVPAHCCAVTTL